MMRKSEHKQKVNEICKGIEQLTLDIKYMPIPKNKKQREQMAKEFKKIGSIVDDTIKEIKKR